MEILLEDMIAMTQFTKNRRGMKVKMCCASCEYCFANGVRSNNTITDERRCTKTNAVTHKKGYCEAWRIREAIDNISTPVASKQGNIHTKGYINYLINGVEDIQKKYAELPATEENRKVMNKEIDKFVFNAKKEYKEPVYLGPKGITRLAQSAVAMQE